MLWDPPGVGGIHQRQFERSCWRAPALAPVPRGAEGCPEGRVRSSQPRQGSKHPPIVFMGLFGSKSGSSPVFHTGRLRLRGRVGMWPRCRKPSPKPRRAPMKYSGRSVRFPPRRGEHHEYCRHPLKFHGCRASARPRGPRYCGRTLRRDTSHLRKAPATCFPLVYPQNCWW